MKVKKEGIEQLSLQEAVLSLSVLPTWGMVGFGRNDMPKGEDLEKAYEDAPKHISLEPYVDEWTRERVTATPRLGISYTGYPSDEDPCWARPIVARNSYEFLRRHEVDRSKLPSLEDFLENPHVLYVEFSLVKPDPAYNPDLGEFSQNQLAALFGLFGIFREHGFHLDDGYLYKNHPNGGIQYHIVYHADARNGSIELYLNDDSEPLEVRIKPEEATKLVRWFEAIE